MMQWDLATGKKVDHWNLLTGLQDRIGVANDGRVFLKRYDIEWPQTGFQPEHPSGVCCLREMIPDGEPHLMSQWKDFTDRIFSIVGTRDGRYFAMDERMAEGDRHTLVVGCSKKQPARVPGTTTNPSIQLVIADEVELLMQHTGGSALFDLVDGTAKEELTFICDALSPDGHLGLNTGAGQQSCILFDIRNKTQLARFQLQVRRVNTSLTLVPITSSSPGPT